MAEKDGDLNKAYLKIGKIVKENETLKKEKQEQMLEVRKVKEENLDLRKQMNFLLQMKLKEI